MLVKLTYLHLGWGAWPNWKCPQPHCSLQKVLDNIIKIATFFPFWERKVCYRSPSNKLFGELVSRMHSYPWPRQVCFSQEAF